jgi:hypothetical protein
MASLICLASTVHAQSPATMRAGLATPHTLSDAAARQHAPLTFKTSRHANSKATKATAGVAMGIVGFGVGAFTTFAVCNAAKCPGSGTPALMAGGIVGAAAGAALGVWLASR